MPSSTMKQVEMECDIPQWIPQDLLRSIFKRLPVRTLIKWQGVCKDWKNLLNGPSFIQEHLEYSAHENPSLLFRCLTVHRPWEVYTINSELQILPVESVPLIEFLRGFTLLGSINGLVCVELKSTYKFESNCKLVNILVCNPAISSFRLLTKEANFYVRMGFGFCSIGGDYKVVIISYHGYSSTGQIHEVEVYSLSTNSWKKVEFGGLLDSVQISRDGFGTNGAIFWSGFKEGKGHLLVSYCIATEEFALIPSPTSAAEFIDSLLCTLSVYENKLALLSHTTYGNYEYTLIDLLVMEERKDSISEERWSWTKKYSGKHPYYHLFPSIVWRNMIFCKYVDKEKDEGIALVNLTTDELKGLARGYIVDFETFSYVESLVTVDKIHIEEL
ncbi:hypothetical protein K1719_016645 [Acacia pycnantha]|nr:hypothetical protein K1719_016645 [Acacia pycnantha]